MKKNKLIIILLLILCIELVGITIAYFSNSTTLDNIFSTKEYGTTYTEEFVSPDNWLPGDTTKKTIIVTNSGSVDEAVRLSYTESWTSKNAKENNEEGDLPLTQNNNQAAVINFSDNDDWEKVTENNKTYYYYKYRLQPAETTSTLLDSVTFNSAIINDTNCVTDTSVAGVRKVTCSSTGDGYDGATYKLSFMVETIQYEKYESAWNTSYVILEEKPIPGTKVLLDKANLSTVTMYNDGDIHEMYPFSHAKTKQTPALTDYRYIGNNPYNYVYFNCDAQGNNCEIWRIIGIFDVERKIDNPDNSEEKIAITESRMKLVRGNCLKNDYWNTSLSNDWSSATLQLFLSEDYYNGTAIDGLKDSARGMIDSAIYYLGASDYTESTESLYALERGDKVCPACSNNPNKLLWEGYVGLMYPSDEFMVYGNHVNDDCYTSPGNCNRDNAESGWIFNSNRLTPNSDTIYSWFLTPQNTRVFAALYSYFGGSLNDNGSVSSNFYGVRPVVYLSVDVKIQDGDGSKDNPYVLK